MCLMCFGLYIDVLRASVRFNVMICIFEHILKHNFGLSEQIENYLLGVEHVENQ